MKVEVISGSGIRFDVELTKDERQNIKEDLEDHLSEIQSLTNSNMTDLFLKEIRNIL